MLNKARGVFFSFFFFFVPLRAKLADCSERFRSLALTQCTELRYCKLKGGNREMFISASDISPHSEERAQIEEASVEMDESTVTNHK